MRRMRRPRVLTLVVSLLLTTGCVTDGGESPRGSGEDEDVKPRLVIAAGADTNRVEPPSRANVAMGYGDANAPVFEPLVRMAPDFSVQPLLATSWEFRSPATWRFRLRENVRFHNGAPLDAEAVVYNVRDLWAAERSNILGVDASSARAVDDLTVDITPRQPNYRMVEQLVHPSFGIRAPGTYAGLGTTSENTPTGTGQYRFAAYRQGEALEVERFDGYWGQKARTPMIAVRFLPESGARVQALEAGDVDAMYDFPREQVPAYADHRRVRTVKSTVGAYAALLLNRHGSPPYDILGDRRVRQALASGIDRATIVDNVWKGGAEVMSTVVPAPVLGPYASTVRGFPYDRQQAQRLLEEAGWTVGGDGVRTKAGRRLELTMLVGSVQDLTPAPELVQAQLRQIGVDVKLDVPSTPAIYFERLEKGQGDIFAEAGNQHDANPIFLGALFTEATGGFPEYGRAFGAGPEYDRLFTEALGTPDGGRARRLAADAMRLAVDESISAVPIAGISRFWGLRGNVRGFDPHPSSVNQRWADTYVAT
ncbi:MAG: ABC transporter substrate-binding protein [Acidimicrobiia bacterium]